MISILLPINFVCDFQLTGLVGRGGGGDSQMKRAARGSSSYLLGVKKVPLRVFSLKRSTLRSSLVPLFLENWTGKKKEWQEIMWILNASFYLGINMSFSHLYRISNTNSCHKWATALKPVKGVNMKKTRPSGKILTYYPVTDDHWQTGKNMIVFFTVLHLPP